MSLLLIGMGATIVVLILVIFGLGAYIASLKMTIKYDQEAFQQAVDHFRSQVQAQEQSEQLPSELESG